MGNVIELQKSITQNFKDRDNAQVEKFMVSLALADPACVELLRKYNVELTKSSQFIVLTQDPKTLTQALELAQKMDFLNAYKADPKRLCQSVTHVIKRMSKCDAMGIPYKKEDGRFESFIFSERRFNEMLSAEKPESKNENVVVKEVTESFDIEDIKEMALRVMEQFDLTEKKTEVYIRLEEIKSSGLGVKEMLMEAFKDYGNVESLGNTVDILLEHSSNKTLGRAA